MRRVALRPTQCLSCFLIVIRTLLGAKSVPWDFRPSTSLPSIQPFDNPLAVWQAARGELLPTATQLVWYVLLLAPERPERGRGMREQEEVRDGGEVPSETKTPGKTGPRDPRHE